MNITTENGQLYIDGSAIHIAITKAGSVINFPPEDFSTITFNKSQELPNIMQSVDIVGDSNIVISKNQVINSNIVAIGNYHLGDTCIK
jgi:hypothetical protein